MEKLIPLPTMKDFIWGEFMEPLHISVSKLAHDIDVPESLIQDVLDGKKEVTADLSIRLGRYFGVSDEIFLDIQKDLDMRKAKRKDQAIFDKIKPIIKADNNISLA